MAKIFVIGINESNQPKIIHLNKSDP